MADKAVFLVKYTDRSLKDALVIKEYLLYKFTQKEVDKFYNMLSVFEGVVSVFLKLYPKS